MIFGFLFVIYRCSALPVRSPPEGHAYPLAVGKVQAAVGVLELGRQR